MKFQFTRVSCRMQVVKKAVFQASGVIPVVKKTFFRVSRPMQVVKKPIFQVSGHIPVVKFLSMYLIIN